MEDEMERLRAMLEGQTGWGKKVDPEPVLTAAQAYATSCRSSSDLDDDEVLSYEHRVGGRLQDTIGHDEVHETFDFPQYNLQFAEEAPEGETFCSLKALQKYPYNFISAASREKVARQFFDNGSFYERSWDFFYIHAPYSPSVQGRQSILLITSRQFQHFLVTINNILGTHLKLPDRASNLGLLFDFPKDGTPRPRYLGHTNEREMAECLKKAVPSSSWRPNDEAESNLRPTEESLEAFKKKIELMLESDKKKKALTKEKKKSERFAKQRAWNREIKRVQRYLGIREAARSNYGPYRSLKKSSSAKLERMMLLKLMDILANIISYQQAMQSLTLKETFMADHDNPGWASINAKDQKSSGELSDPKVVDIHKPAPYMQEDSVVFICIDVEAYERDSNLITEIGIATLDTADIKALSPGEAGINWTKKIRARHFRIRENGHLKNKEFIIGCADDFRFGDSEWIGIQDAPQEISKCFKPPYSNLTADLTIEQSVAPGSRALDTKRNIILVGHDIMADINYLRKIGYDPFNLSNLQELIDTSSMYRAFKREPNPRNLGSILATIDIAGWYLHNAGNDAVYTLQAMISIAIRALQEQADEEEREKESEVRIAESVQNAIEVAREAQQGWSSEGSDGGWPLAPTGRLQTKGSGQVRYTDTPRRANKIRFDSTK